MKNKQEAVLSLIIIIVIFSIFLSVSIKTTPGKEVVKDVRQIPDNTVNTKVPAVDSKGNGIMLDLKVEVTPGEGRVFTDIENLVFWVDTQNSIKTAKDVAENLMNINTSNLDFTYTLKAERNATIVGGSSAGATLTIATIAAIKGKTLNESIIITGSINENGSIGAVGGISGKINISKKFGAKLFLLPKGQEVSEALLEPIKKCEIIDSKEICELNYEKIKTIPLEKEMNITIREVSNISQVMEYYKL